MQAIFGGLLHEESQRLIAVQALGVSPEMISRYSIAWAAMLPALLKGLVSLPTEFRDQISYTSNTSAAHPHPTSASSVLPAQAFDEAAAVFHVGIGHKIGRGFPNARSGCRGSSSVRRFRRGPGATGGTTNAPRQCSDGIWSVTAYLLVTALVPCADRVELPAPHRIAQTVGFVVCATCCCLPGGPPHSH